MGLGGSFGKLFKEGGGKYSLLFFIICSVSHYINLIRFVTMQGISWCLFSFSLLMGAWSLQNTALVGTWTLTGTLGFLSELIMVFSVQMYLPKTESVGAPPGSMQDWLNTAIRLGKRARRFLVTVLLFNVFFAPIMVAISAAIPFLFASTPWVWGAIITFVVAVYTPTFFLTNPHKTGAIESSKLRTSFLVEDVMHYFNGRLVKTAEIDTTKQYIFGVRRRLVACEFVNVLII